jgi:hypothetical protein
VGTLFVERVGSVFPVGEGNGDFLEDDFGDQKVRVDVP